MGRQPAAAATCLAALLLLLAMPSAATAAAAAALAAPPARETINFDFGWRHVLDPSPPALGAPAGPPPQAAPGFPDAAWPLVDAPHDMLVEGATGQCRPTVKLPPMPPLPVPVETPTSAGDRSDTAD